MPDRIEITGNIRVHHPIPRCDTNWGSHGCFLERGHAGHHDCTCCDCPDHMANLGRREDEDGAEYWCVATWPYYGPDTKFSGADA